MKRNLLPLMFFAAFALLAVAIAVDCVRLAGEAAENTRLAYTDVAKQEERFAKLVAASPQVTPEVQSALAEYRTAQSIPERHASFDQLTAAFQQTMSPKLDATNPLDRKFMDDAAGAMNRRQVAEKPFQTELTAYQQYLNTWRGQIARWFSSPAARDHQQNSQLLAN
jgi:hypothetical protein